MGIFITFEGIEGCGKTTQLQRLAARLRAEGRSVLVTREPGGCAIADALRGILLDSANSAMAATTELLLYAAARAQHVAEVIQPALAAETIVLCDRFSDATLAYQGYGRGLDTDLIRQLNTVATAGLQPDLTLLLDFPVAVGLNRARQRNAGCDGPDEGRFEAEALEFHERVRSGYLLLAASEPRIHVADAEGEPATVAARIDAVVTPLLAVRRPA